jgi:hypothetical protein
MGKKERRQIWTNVATALGGQHHLPSKWWRGDEHILASINKVPVKLDTYVVSSGHSSQTFTRIAADYALGPGPKLKVYKQGFFSSIAKALGMRDIALGDKAFDDRFVVRSNSVALARRLWTPLAMEHMTRVEKTQLQSKPKRVELIFTGLWKDPEAMQTGFLLIGELASRDIYGAHSLATLGTLVGEPPHVELDTGTHVIIATAERDDTLVMVAKTAQPIAHEPITLDVVDGTYDQQLASKLPQAAHVHLREAGSGRLVVGGETMFVWSSLELDPARLRAGAELLGALAAARGGVYR